MPVFVYILDTIPTSDVNEIFNNVNSIWITDEIRQTDKFILQYSNEAEMYSNPLWRYRGISSLQKKLIMDELRELAGKNDENKLKIYG